MGFLNVNKSVSIFDTTQERILNIFALVCLLFSILQFAFGNQIIGGLQAPESLRYAAKYLFLNYIHVFFIPIMLLTTDSGTNWIKERFENRKFMASAILFYAGTFLVSWIMFKFSPQWVWILTYAILAWSALHNVRQSFGMSQMYRRKSEDKSVYDSSKSARTFRFWAPVIMALLFLRFIGFEMNFPTKAVLFTLVATAVTLYVFEPAIRNRKWGYVQYADCRLLLYPLALVSPVAIFGILSIHGMEYLFLTRKYFLNEQNLKRRVPSKNFLIAVVFMLLLINFGGQLNTTVEQAFQIQIHWNPELLMLITANAAAINLFHYWFDGLVFSGKNQANRKWVLSNLN